MSARLFVCLWSAEGPLWCHDSTQWGTIECTGPLPPRHTVCVPFSYANESCRRQTLPSPIAPSLPCSPSKTSPDLSLCPNFSELERPLNSEAEQLCETFALRVMGIRTQQASWGNWPYTYGKRSRLLHATPLQMASLKCHRELGTSWHSLLGQTSKRHI